MRERKGRERRRWQKSLEVANRRGVPVSAVGRKSHGFEGGESQLNHQSNMVQVWAWARTWYGVANRNDLSERREGSHTDMPGVR